MLFTTLLESIGHTPLVQLCGSEKSHARLFAKMELNNLCGMKDRFALNAIITARATGELKEGGMIIESSSGTLAVGLAMVGRALGYEVYIVTDPRIDELTLTKLRAFGAVIDMVTEKLPQGGWQSARLERLYQIMKQHPDAFWPRQYTNINNPLAYTQLAQELLADLDHIDALVGPVGSGGSLCGTARVLKQSFPHLTVVAVDTVGSVIFDQPDIPRLQGGLGNSILPSNVDKSLIDRVHWLNDEEAFNATLHLANHEQIFAGNSSGSAYWVACWLCDQLPVEATVVVIFPDRGDRYYTTVYNHHYWEKHRLEPGCLPLAPVEVSYGTEVKQWSHAKMVLR